jgi:hypothetical protein
MGGMGVIQFKIKYPKEASLGKDIGAEIRGW